LLSDKATKLIEFNLQTRDQKTAKAKLETTKLDPTKTGVVVIDMWNWRWCKTATERVSAMVPRMERCLKATRELGMQVFYCPTDSVDYYVGTPQREAVFAAPLRPLPEMADIEYPQPPGGRGCACGENPRRRENNQPLHDRRGRREQRRRR